MVSGEPWLSDSGWPAGRLHSFRAVLSRAVETCRIAGYGDVAVITDELMEWDDGAYEGRSALEIREGRPGWSLWPDGAPAGETAEQVATPAKSVIERAVAAEGDVALVAHGRVLRVLTACWLGLAPFRGQPFAMETASLSVLGYERDTRIINKWNQDSHLVAIKTS